MGGVETADGQTLGRGLAHGHAGPAVPRLILGAQLRRLREQAGISREQAGEAIRASHSKISRLELGRNGCKPRDVADLLTLYGVGDEAERETMLALAGEANIPAWWQAYGDVTPAWLQGYLGVEQSAEIIRTFEVQFVPGLLQTEAYARAVIRLGHPDASRRELTRRVELRTRRQEILRRARPARLWAVIDEAALWRPMGGVPVMRAQLHHLIELCRQRHVTIQIMPFEAGGHVAAGGPITMIRLPEPDLPDLVYLEQLISAVYVEKPDEVGHYWHIMNSLVTEACLPSETPAILHRILTAL